MSLELVINRHCFISKKHHDSGLVFNSFFCNRWRNTHK